MTIGEAESRTGLDRATIRYYEREGLLSPRRMENGYRDYGEQEMTALLRIKLLRELGISLEDIRSLQQGTLALPQTLAVRIEQLEREISASTQAKETCRAIREEGVSYAALDAEKYLNREVRLPGTVHDAPPPPNCPWRRYLARSFDWLLCEIALMAILAMGFHVNLIKQSPFLSLALSLIALGLVRWIEPLLLHWFGTTPGKAIFGLRVEHLDGGRPTWEEARARTGQVIWQGLGWHIPFYSWYRLYQSYQQHIHGEEMPWDWENDLHLEAKPGAWWRGVVYLAAVGISLAAMVLVILSAAFPPHFGPLTPAEYAENYSFLWNYYGNSPYQLDGQGKWNLREEGTAVISFSALPAVTLETDAAGYVCAVTAEWTYRGEEALIFWPGQELENFTLALAAGEGGWLSYFGRLEQVAALSGMDSFSAATIQAGGVTLTTEATWSGYEATGNGILFLTDESDPSAAFCQITCTVEAG